MRGLRLFALALGLSLFLGPIVAADADDEAQKKREKGKGFGRASTSQPLLSEAALDKLKLSTEQKDKVDKIVKEFADKSKDLGGKVREDFQKAIKDKDKDAIKTAATAMREVREKEEKLRSEFQEKVAAVLTDAQKKTFEDVKKEQPGRGAPGGFQPFARPGAGGGAPGLVLPKNVQEELKLTDEQKEKIAKLQKEIDAKLSDVLTEEQKKKFEELKKGGANPQQRRPGARPKAAL